MRCRLAASFALVAGCLALPSAAAAVGPAWRSLGPGGGGAFNSPCIQGRTWAVGSDLGGLYVSRDRGTHWTPIGASRGLTATHVASTMCLADGRVAVGTDDGIYMLRADLGRAAQVWRGNYISAIVGTANPSVLFAAAHPTWNSLAPFLLRSIDGGRTWRRTAAASLPANLRVVALRSHPVDPDAVVVVSGEGRFRPDPDVVPPAQAWLSTDGGGTFDRLAAGVGDVADVVYTHDPANLNEMLLTTRGPSATWRSTDAGGSWRKRSNRTGVLLASTARPGQISIVDMRAFTDWNPAAGIYRSTDDAATWRRVSTAAGWQHGWSTSIRVWGIGQSFQGELQTTAVSADGTQILWTDGQFVYASTDSGTTFRTVVSDRRAVGRWRSRGIDNAVPIVISPSMADANLAYVGYRDMGLWRTDDGGTSWRSLTARGITDDWGGGVFGGNTFAVAADPVRSNVVWASIGGDPEPGNSRLLRSTNRGATWSRTSGLPPGATMLSGLSVDPRSPTTARRLFVVADGRVYRSVDDGRSWKPVLSFSGVQFTWVLAGAVYAGGSKGLYRSASTTALSWRAVALPVPPAQPWWDPRHPPAFWDGDYSGVNDLTVRPNGELWAAVLGAGFYRSRDKGLTWRRVQPDRFARTIVAAGDRLIAGSSSALNSGGYSPESDGVMVSDDGGRSWVARNEGLAYPFATSVRVGRGGTAWWLLSPGQGVLRR